MGPFAGLLFEGIGEEGLDRGCASNPACSSIAAFSAHRQSRSPFARTHAKAPCDSSTVTLRPLGISAQPAAAAPSTARGCGGADFPPFRCSSNRFASASSLQAVSSRFMTPSARAAPEDNAEAQTQIPIATQADGNLDRIELSPSSKRAPGGDFPCHCNVTRAPYLSVTVPPSGSEGRRRSPNS